MVEPAEKAKKTANEKRVGSQRDPKAEKAKEAGKVARSVFYLSQIVIVPSMGRDFPLFFS